MRLGLLFCLGLLPLAGCSNNAPAKAAATPSGVDADVASDLGPVAAHLKPGTPSSGITYYYSVDLSFDDCVAQMRTQLEGKGWAFHPVHESASLKTASFKADKQRFYAVDLDKETNRVRIYTFPPKK